MHIPLHRQIAARLERSIRASHRPGDRLPGEAELAAAWKVSPLTMAKVLAILSQKGVIHRRAGAGTFVKEPGMNGWIGVLIEYDIGSPYSSLFFRRLAQGCRTLCNERGVLSRLYAGFSDFANPATRPTSRELMEDCEREALCGAVVMAGAEIAGSLQHLKARGVPVAGINPRCHYQIVSERPAMLGRFVTHALARGRRRFAMIDWECGLYEVNSIYSLREPFREILRSHGLPFYPEWLRGDLHPALPGSGWEEFREIWSSRRERPDALIVGDEHLLPDINAALRSLGVTPRELSLYCYATGGNRFYLDFPVILAETDTAAMAAALIGHLAPPRLPLPQESVRLDVPLLWNDSYDPTPGVFRDASTPHLPPPTPPSLP